MAMGASAGVISGSGPYAGCTGAQVDAAVQSAVAEIQQSVRAEVRAPPTPPQRLSLLPTDTP